MGDPKQRSKKRSNSKKQQHRGFTLYLCHNIDYDDVADVLRRNGIRFKRHRDCFHGSTPDTELLKKVGKKRWILITADQKQRTRKLESELIQYYKIRQFVFTSSEVGDVGELLVKARIRMRNLCREHEGPFVYSISKSGNVSARTLR